ncbi:hypothetical protein M407DRAFT_241472 [Tulasnella calospora MUT 4182]|uniref:Uncharacterized protein n=1 Tax=Tulasnella calospora MUT 4182 TaxID=1051891 RepID=A0A0C3MFB3_9AGAM|nr:hypothetical protein M407DRAFT_241472 [Tulasnella calospora MUT 4182]
MKVAVVIIILTKTAQNASVVFQHCTASPDTWQVAKLILNLPPLSVPAAEIQN